VTKGFEESNNSFIRLYVAEDNDINITGSGHLNASIYAPQAVLNFTGSLMLDGSVFVKELNGSGAIIVRYDSNVDGGISCDDQDDDGDENNGVYDVEEE